MKPIIDDFGDGYYIFCPKCYMCLGREGERPDKCEFCGAEIDWSEEI